MEQSKIQLYFCFSAVWEFYYLIGYVIHATVEPFSSNLRDIIKEHTWMHELRIAHGYYDHNHNKAENILWDIWIYLYLFKSELTTQFFIYFNSLISIILLNFLIFLVD